MQIHIAAGSPMDMRAERNDLNNSLFGKRNESALKINAGSVFGSQCKVTISREGKRLSGQSGLEAPRSLAAANAERLLLREQEQAQQGKAEHADTIKEISDLMSAIRNSYDAGEDKETIEKKQQALQRLLDLKARQEEENEQRVKDAEGNAAGASKAQAEIDRKNADLYMLLKSFEEQEKDEEEAAGAQGDTADAGDGQGQGSVGEQFDQSASMLGVSAARRELQAKGAIEELSGDGYDKLAMADEMMHEIQAEIDMALESAGKEYLSEDEKNQLMSEHIGNAKGMLMSNYGEITELRRKGHQEIKDARELDLRHIAVNPLDGVDQAKQAIMDAGVAAARREASRNTLDKASEELEERVQDAIDRRDDVASGADTDDDRKQAEVTEEEQAEALEERAREQEELEKKSNLMN